MSPLPPLHTYTKDGVLVVYIYGALSSDVFKEEIRILESFIGEWNASDEKTTPVGAIIVRPEENPEQDTEHTNVAIATQELWNHDPRESKESVQVFYLNNNPADGYDRHIVLSRDKTKFTNKIDLAWLKAALDNYVPRPE